MTPHELMELAPLAMDAEAIKADFGRYLCFNQGRDRYSDSTLYRYRALALAIRDRLMERWKRTSRSYYQADARRGYYLSMEYLMGRALSNAVLNLDLEAATREALNRVGMSIEDIEAEEVDAGLGNGGLGRLAACFLDSCATLQLPLMGYGLRYQYGMFRQSVCEGRQVEEPDNWLVHGNPWEVERPEHTVEVPFGGRVERYRGDDGVVRAHWVDTEAVLAVPYDLPIPGYHNGTVNTLRLWKATATNTFDLAEFNDGDYTDAVAAKNEAEKITMVLYPNDSSESGKELRLRQQFFLASASLQDALRRWQDVHGDDFSRFADKNRFQLNDTHPAVAVAELMRLLIDRHHLEWKAAWSITTKTMAYTNHTLLPEALEKWPVRLFERLLPRTLEIIYEINMGLLRQVSNRWPNDVEHLQRMSIIEEGPERMVRMAHLAVTGSFSVNGVAELHSDLLKDGLLRDFYELWPWKFNNKTNGVTQRRWLAQCNPGLRALISAQIGEGWITDLSQLTRLRPLAEDPEFRHRWRAVKADNKARLAALIQAQTGIKIAPHALYDVQVKRIHEYKRQLLNLLHAIHLYDRIKRGDVEGWVDRVILIGGKAAPGYMIAKRIIKLCNDVAAVINEDEEVGDKLKLVFLPNYNVSAMEIIAPGADLSEQISTAGKEASGTGNMKFMMNGALTIGTLDGANIEIREEVGEDNFFLFGMTAAEVERHRHAHDPRGVLAADEDIRRVIDLIRRGHFNQMSDELYGPILDGLLVHGDYWMVLADLRAFIDAQRRVAAAFKDVEGWTRMSVLNAASSGKFSTDRTMRAYNEEIWGLPMIKPNKGDAC